VVALSPRLADHAVEAQLRPEVGAHPRTEHGHDDQADGHRAHRYRCGTERTRTGDDRAVVRWNVHRTTLPDGGRRDTLAP
jgi:hypothetical protein